MTSKLTLFFIICFGVVTLFVASMLTYKSATNSKAHGQIIIERIQQGGDSPKDTYVGECQRQHISVTPEECKKHEVSELEDKRTFPTHHVSGAPGSGNDWILWLGSLTRYTWTRYRRQKDCEVYKRQRSDEEAYLRNTTECLFLKSHEPWFHSLWCDYAARGVLLLRHPYDAVFAEYKRQLAFRTGVNITTEELKSSTAGQTVEAFLNVSTNTTSDVWKKRLRNYIPRWLKHAKYWLTEYTRPLHILIYNRVKENPMEEIEKMQAFLGYQFDGANFRRHCCVVKNPENKSLKRQPGPIDKYRNYALEQEAVIRRKYKDAVSKVHDMLDKKFPNTKYRITRG